MASIREHPRFWLAVALVLGLIIGGYVFGFYSGLHPGNVLLGLPTTADPVRLAVCDVYTVSATSCLVSLSQLGQPPIIVSSRGTRPLNVTWTSSTNGPDVVYEWWFQWPNSTLHPTNIWEPVYVYYDVSNPAHPALLALYTRFHFVWRPVTGPYLLNGTRLVVKFSDPPFYIPYENPGFLFGLFLTTTRPVQTSSYPSIYDPASPYPAGPNAYATGSGPTDPWTGSAFGSYAPVQGGLVYGLVVGSSASLGGYVVILVTVHPRAGRHRVRIRKRLIPLLET